MKAGMLDKEHRSYLRRLRFREPLESQFLDDYVGRSMGYLRAIMFAETALSFIGIFMIGLIDSNAQLNQTVLVFRVGIWTLLFASTFWRGFRKHLEDAIGAVCLVHVLVVHYALAASPPTPAEAEDFVFVTVAIRCLELFLFCTVLRLRFRMALLLGVVSTMSFLAAYALQLHVSNEKVIVATVIVTSTAAITILTAFHLEATARNAFLHAHLLAEEREKSERLLLNILPEAVVERLKNDPAAVAESHPNVSVLFADLVDFTPLSATLGAKEVVDLLNEVFSEFDQLTEERGLEKIKTIGDCYMAVGGVPLPRADHLTAIADLALAMQQTVAEVDKRRGLGLTLRIGIHTGPVVAGVIGKNRFIYDLWGDTVNIASRMESHGLPGEIQVTPQVYDGLRDQFQFQPREAIQVKGRGEMTTYFLAGDTRELARREAAVCN